MQFPEIAVATDNNTQTLQTSVSKQNQYDIFQRSMDARLPENENVFEGIELPSRFGKKR